MASCAMAEALMAISSTIEAVNTELGLFMEWLPFLV